MIDQRPLWKRPLGMTLLVLIAGGSGAWLALDRPLPQSWLDDSGRPKLELPEIFKADQSNRLFCAESIDTGGCSCISSNGERPQISDEECRRRARDSDTTETPEAAN